MKKLISIILIIAIMLMNIISFAEEGEVYGLEENLSELFMTNNFTEEQINKIDEEYTNAVSEYLLNRYLPGKKALGKWETESEEEEYALEMDKAKLNYDKGMRISLLYTRNYALEYAQKNTFHYLFSGKEYWAVPNNNQSDRGEFTIAGHKIENIENEFSVNYSGITLPANSRIFLENTEDIEKMLLEKGETEVNDIKLFSIWHGITLLYIRCNENEYLIKLYGDTSTGKEHMQSIEKYKLYPAEDVIQAILNKEEESFVSRQNLIFAVEQQKPTYETEATALQEEGLLQGNENGLDLLKPLTRIEAATMLLRAIGEDNFTETEEEEIFTDVPVTHWGCKSAAKAYSLGLIQGIGDNLFAPDKTVTGEEFSTMVLRAAGTDEFDWQEALNILVEKGIITEENTETMDLFTRGDMAKIIYEARENGLL